MEVVRLARQVWETLLVCDANGRCVLLDELAGLDPSFDASRRKILAFLRYNLPQEGPDKLFMFRDKIEDNLFEFTLGRFRVIWFRESSGRIVICTSMFLKTTRRTPEGEKTRARNLRSAYFEAQRGRRLTVRDYNEEQESNA